MNMEVQRFVDAVSDDRRALYDMLEALIMGMYPEPEVGISYGIPTIKTGKGAINFKLTDKIPVAALKKIIKLAIEQPRGR